MSTSPKNETFILGCPQKDGTVAILCRSSGFKPGPAVCESKRDAVKLKTKLVNDPRGQDNNRALEIIKNLLIYQVVDGAEIFWEEGSLWAFLKTQQVKCVESPQRFF